MITTTIMISMREKAFERRVRERRVRERRRDGETKRRSGGAAFCALRLSVSPSLRLLDPSSLRLFDSLNSISRLQNRQHGRENDQQYNARQQDDQERFEDGGDAL